MSGRRRARVHGHQNGLKTAMLLGLLSAIIIAISGLFGRGALVIGLVIALGMNAFAYFSSDKLALRAMHARPVSEVEQPAMYRIVRELAHVARPPMPQPYLSPTRAPPPPPPPDAAALPEPDRRAQRVRDRPQPAPSGRLLHHRHPRPAGRAGAAAAPLPRAIPRLQPRHPHLVRRRRAAEADQRAREHRAVLRRQQPRRQPAGQPDV